MKITALTATGARPEAFGLCRRFMLRQNFDGPIRWIIVDDGPEPLKIGEADFDARFRIQVVRPRPYWHPGHNTQARNLREGLELIGPDERVAIIEDDDWYASDWLTAVYCGLEGVDLYGDAPSTYYNAATRIIRPLNNCEHASLCSTAIQGPAINRLRAICSAAGRKFIDIELWKQTPSERKRIEAGGRVVGMKGLPGRGNIGIGKALQGDHDPHLERLAALVGSESKLYRPFLRR